MRFGRLSAYRFHDMIGRVPSGFNDIAVRVAENKLASLFTFIIDDAIPLSIQAFGYAFVIIVKHLHGPYVVALLLQCIDYVPS